MARNNMVNNTEGRKKYIIGEEITMGICLKPEDIKGLKAKAVDISRAWCTVKNNEVYIVNMRIKDSSIKTEDGKLSNPDRKLLDKRDSLDNIISKVFKERLVIVPLDLSFNEDGKLKVTVGIGSKNPDYVQPVKKQFKHTNYGHKQFNGQRKNYYKKRA